MVRIIDIKKWALRDRIFALAILFSAVWHIFWLSIVTVVITPKDTGVIKFSKVSFLGPILERGVLEVRIEPTQRSFLEKRYLKLIIDQAPLDTSWDTKEAGVRPLSEKDFYILSDEKLRGLIKDTLGTSRLEPAREMD